MADNEVDVRELRKPDKHPTIFAAFGALAVGESFVLVNKHDPKHLRQEFDADHPGSYGWDYLEKGPRVWRIRITRLTSTPLPRILAYTNDFSPRSSSCVPPASSPGEDVSPGAEPDATGAVSVHRWRQVLVLEPAAKPSARQAV